MGRGGEEGCQLRGNTGQGPTWVFPWWFSPSLKPFWHWAEGHSLLGWERERSRDGNSAPIFCTVMDEDADGAGKPSPKVQGGAIPSMHPPVYPPGAELGRGALWGGTWLWGWAGSVPEVSPPGCPSLAENGALRNGTEEVLCLEQCPPTKRLKAALCNSNKEQRVEEDQTRGTGVRCGLAGALGCVGFPEEKEKGKGKGKGKLPWSRFACVHPAGHQQTTW